jgi:Gram-negative bacterial TonB protein C-terminal
MRSTPSSRPLWATSLAALTSVVAHLCALGIVLARPALLGPSNAEQILPALYLYAPDRRPSLPREIRIPTVMPPGNPRGFADGAPQVELAGTSSKFHDGPVKGLPLPGPNAVNFDSVFSAIAVDSEVTRYDWSIAPVYPDSLFRAGAEGLVEAEFVVDTTGRVDLGTIRILKSTHLQFRESVEADLAGMQFRPAWRGLMKVRQLVAQRFAFRLIRPLPGTES